MRIVIPIFDVPVYVYACPDVYDFLKQRGHTPPEQRCMPACTFYERSERGGLRICVAFHSKRRPITPTVVHEAVHIVNMIFQEKGIAPDLENDEVQAYLTEFIADKISKMLWKQKGLQR
jgi:hypothetical protein